MSDLPSHDGRAYRERVCDGYMPEPPAPSSLRNLEQPVSRDDLIWRDTRPAIAPPSDGTRTTG